MIQISKSDCQIPNHDFETVLADGNLSNWGNIFLSATVIDSAGNQFADSIIFNGPFNGPSADSYSGASALEIRNAYSYTSGDVFVGSATVDTDSVYTAWGNFEMIPAQIQPTELNFYFKHFPVNGDTSVAYLGLYDQFGYQIGSAKALLIGTVSNYTLVSFPVDYTSNDSVFAYSLTFSNFYSESDLPIANFGTVTLIDDVSFGFTTSIEQLGSKSDITIYPNPVQENINISPIEGNTIHYELIDTKGKIVQVGNLVGRAIPLSSSYGSGSYLLRIYNEGKIIDKKIVIK